MLAADSLLKAGDLKGSIAEFARMHQENPENTDFFYNYACAFALNWQPDSAFHYLNLSLVGDSSVRKLNDPDFYFLIEDERWSEIEDKLIAKVEAKYGSYDNLPLAKELWKMKIKDQAFYYHLSVARSTGATKSALTPAIWELKKKINHDNVERLEEIIAEHGWPTRSMVGSSAASSVFLIIQHADIEVQKKYLPMMKEAANNKEASWASLALLIDRVNLREGKQQIYGSQIYGNDDGTHYVKDLFDPEYVNQRRKEVGLGPIEDYVKRWGIEWDIEQKEK